VPVAAAVGRADVFASLEYGEGSDTWSANPICCAAVLTTLEEFATRDVLAHSRRMSTVIEEGLVGLKKLPFIARVRGEEGGMVWGVETADHAGRSASDWANDIVLACYQGDGKGGPGIHLLGPLAKKVVRIAPPLTITEKEAHESMELMAHSLARLAGDRSRSSGDVRPAAISRH
jgi:4-aminobutyrate aminotransferase-like enzyme